MAKQELQRPETAVLHTGTAYAKETGAVIAPIFQTSTFAADNEAGFDYTRSGNPNFKNLEEAIAAVEGAAHAVVYSSGVAAITAIVSTLKSGDVVLAEENIYGCTYRMFAEVFGKFGVAIEYLDFTDPKNFARIAEVRPALVWLESPTNPLLKIVDIEAVSEVANAVGAAVVVDNTFASSYFQQPLALGATLSLTSTTKYLNGHSDCLGGAVCCNDEAWREKLLFSQKALGLNPSPFDSWLVLRGIRTLPVRMKAHEENALALAQFLENELELPLVRYPFLDSHPQVTLAKRQMKGGSGIVVADLNCSYEKTRTFLSRLQLFTTAQSLGGVESLVCHPATMSHASVPKEVREAVGITDSLVRFSVGIEAKEDLLADVGQAFAG